jgi:NAD(P)-dependent dehydrogenase (short-subunit alcohol dehydrogenase family)
MTADQSSEAIPRVAIVTGGSRGLGRSTVLALARRGVDAIFTYRSNESEAEKVSTLAAEAGRKAVALQLDVGDVRALDAFVDDVRRTLAVWTDGRFDYLVNNAGVGLHKPFDQTAEDELDALYRVHFKGVYVLTQKLLPLLRDGGRIVNVSSGLTRFAFPGTSAYASMKGAIEVLTRHLAKELGPRGIAVNTVAPGAIATDFGGGYVRDDADLNKRLADMTALGRVGQPDDIGPMIAALLSDENRWINAQRIEVSGGMIV